MLRFVWIALLIATAALLYAEAHSRLPFDIATALFPIGIGLAIWTFRSHPVARRPRAIAGTILLLLAFHGVMLLMLGVQNRDAFSNRQDTLIALMVVFLVLTILFAFAAFRLVRGVATFASVPLLILWSALVCIEIGGLNLQKLVQPSVSEQKSHRA